MQQRQNFVGESKNNDLARRGCFSMIREMQSSAASLRVAVLCVFLALLGGCATPRNILIENPLEPKEKIYVTTSVQRGKASYYYGRWIGRKTANGEIYRASDVTAAHKTLPFNTMVRVTNLKNGKQVIVRINNRGPYIRGRIIDLSLEAAKRIDMTKAGVVPVTVEVLKEVPVLRSPNLRRSPMQPAAEPTPTATPAPKPTPAAAGDLQRKTPPSRSTPGGMRR